MNILNVVEVEGNHGVKITSFVFREDSVRRDYVNKRRVNEAEKLFLSIAEENGMKEEESSFCLEQGMFERGNYKLFLKWSE